MVKALLLTLILLVVWLPDAAADTLYFKNGRKAEGLVVSEEGDSVVLNVGAGVIKVKKVELLRVERSPAEDTEALKFKWQAQKDENEKKILERNKQRARAPETEKVKVDSKDGQITVKATINGRTSATLVLDTGATQVLLSKKTAKKLGITLKGDKDKENKDVIQVTVADGRKVKAQKVRLASLEVQGIKALNVDAAVLLDEKSGKHFEDGLLGMSFLSRYIFRVDYARKELLLEKRK